MELRGSFFTIFQIVVYISSSVDSAGFTDYPPTSVPACSGTSATLTWVYDNTGDVSVVNWKFGITDILNFIPSTSTLLYGTGYDASRISHDGNGGITLNATVADTGNYSCSVTYNSFPKAEDTKVLDVFNTFSEVLTINSIRISKAEVQLFSSINDSSITYTWTHDEGSSSGKEYTARKCGDYRLYISGGKSVCLATGLHRYTEVYVKIVDDTKLIACLFMALVIYALVIVIGILILCKRNFIDFDKLKADKVSLAAIVVGFILVVIIASIIGWITSENCWKIGESIGVGIGIGVVIGIVILIIIYKRCRDTKVREERNLTSENGQSGKSLLDNVPPGRQLPPARLPPIENKKFDQDMEKLT